MKPEPVPVWVASTARWIAAARARESSRPDRLFDDPYADLFAGEIGRAMMHRTERSAGKENAYIPVRVRYFDDLFLRLSHEVDQVVMPGAGFDTRAFRLPLNPSVRMFELDTPETMAEKSAHLEQAGAVPNCELTYVGTQFEDGWIEDLISRGLDTSAKTLWLAEGLFFYLSSEQVASLLKCAHSASAAGSVFAADMFATGILCLEQMNAYLSWLSSESRPLPFCSDDPTDIFRQAGWSDVHSIQLGQSEANFDRVPAIPEGIPILPAAMFIAIAQF